MHQPIITRPSIRGTAVALDPLLLASPRVDACVVEISLGADRRTA